MTRYVLRCARPHCGQPAHWYLDDGTWVCEAHALEALRECPAEVRGILDNDPVVIGESGELEKAS